jgi:protein-S-isoprenylcysteine O-methyltransferase Ste14
MRFLGTIPITPLAYLAGKVSLLACWGTLIARPFCPGVVWFRSPGLGVLGAVLLVVGLLLMVAAGVNLGGSLRMGLPTEKTALRTSGPYRYSRNPMYVGGFLTCLAALAWTANPVIFVLSAVAAIVHHRIVLAEEKYLAAEFGEAWTEYSRKVRRYL